MRETMLLRILFVVGNVRDCLRKTYTSPTGVSRSLHTVPRTGKFFVIGFLLLFLCQEVVPTAQSKSSTSTLRHYLAQSQNYDGGYIVNNRDGSRQTKTTRNTNRDQHSTPSLTSQNPLSSLTTVYPCSDTVLDECFDKMPNSQSGIPSTSAEVEIACKAFDIGMKCMNDWSSACLDADRQAIMKASVQGAHETFTFLCADSRFRKEFLKHGGCYRKITQLWEVCANDFIENIKKSDHQSPRKICCVRIRFLQCVTELSHLQCGKESADFLQLLAENLARETMGNANKDHSNSKSGRLQCASYTYKNCSSGDKRNSAVSTFSKWSSPSFTPILPFSLFLISISPATTASLFL